MRIVMMGTGTFADPTFARLLAGPHEVVGLFTQPDRAPGKERGSTRLAGQPMKERALAHGVAVFQPESINTAEGLAALESLNSDLLVVAAYGQILSRDVLGSARLGGINVHASLLPKYRGAAPIHWAIYHGETHSGVSIIRMTTGLDAGEILSQEAVEILLGETSGELESRLAPLGAKLAAEVVDRLAVGPVEGVPQDKSQVTKAPKLTKEAGLIDWTRPAAAVVNQVRAMQPWPTAYTFFQKARLIVTRAVAHDGIPLDAGDDPLGTAHAVGGRLWVRAGDGQWVEIVELQPAGKKRMSASDFLRGRIILTHLERMGGEQS